MRDFILLARSSDLRVRRGTLTRFLAGALLLSHGTRKDVRASILFDDETLISFEGWSMRNVRPDEQSLSGILVAGVRRASQGRSYSKILRGVTARGSSLDEAARAPNKYYYKGPGRTFGVEGDLLVVLSSEGMGEMREESLKKRGFDALRVGARPLTPDQAAVIINNLVDRATWRPRA